MNIAICISGTARTLDCSQHSIKLIKQTGNTKVFIHTWSSADFNTLQNTLHGGVKPEKEREDTVHKISSSLQEIESLSIDNFDSFSEKFAQDRDKVKLLANKKIGPFSMFYSINRCNELKKLYELNHNIKFDIVYRMRFDSYITTPGYLLRKIEHTSNYIYIPKCSDYEGVCDQFAYGSSQSMDIYSQVYENLDSLLNFKQHYRNPEQMLQSYLEMKNITVERTQLGVCLECYKRQCCD